MAKRVKSERDKLAAKARKMTNEAGKLVWRAAFCRVLEQLGKDANTEAARESMLRALVDGKSVEDAEIAALSAGRSGY